MESYRTYGTHSQRVAEVCDGIEIANLADPSNIVFADYNWIAQGGYVDNDLLDGKDGTAPALTFTLERQGLPGFATIHIGGIAKEANALPFAIRSVAPKNPIFIYNVPLLPGTYTRTRIFSQPDEDDVIDVTTFTVE